MQHIGSKIGLPPFVKTQQKAGAPVGFRPELKGYFARPIMRNASRLWTIHTKTFRTMIVIAFHRREISRKRNIRLIGMGFADPAFRFRICVLTTRTAFKHCNR